MAPSGRCDCTSERRKVFVASTGFCRWRLTAAKLQAPRGIRQAAFVLDRGARRRHPHLGAWRSAARGLFGAQGATSGASEPGRSSRGSGCSRRSVDGAHDIFGSVFGGLLEATGDAEDPLHHGEHQRASRHPARRQGRHSDLAPQRRRRRIRGAGKPRAEAARPAAVRIGRCKRRISPLRASAASGSLRGTNALFGGTPNETTLRPWSGQGPNVSRHAARMRCGVRGWDHQDRQQPSSPSPHRSGVVVPASTTDLRRATRTPEDSRGAGERDGLESSRPPPSALSPTR